eukprot:148294-Rhodomonas_salina.3
MTDRGYEVRVFADRDADLLADLAQKDTVSVGSRPRKLHRAYSKRQIDTFAPIKHTRPPV